MNKEEIKRFVTSVKRTGGVIATEDPHYVSILKHFLQERVELTEEMKNEIVKKKKVDYFINFSNYIDLSAPDPVFNKLFIV